MKDYIMYRKGISIKDLQEILDRGYECGAIGMPKPKIAYEMEECNAPWRHIYFESDEEKE